MRSPRSPVRSCPAAGWSSPCTPARRSATTTTGSTCRSTSTSCSTSRPTSWPLVEAAGLIDLEWYHRGPIVARGETTERLYVVGRKPADHARPVLLDVRSRPRHPDAPARPRLPGGRPRRPLGHRRPGDPAGDRRRDRGGRRGGARRRGGGAPGSGADARPRSSRAAQRAPFVFPRMFGAALTPPMATDLLGIAAGLAPGPAGPRARRARRPAGRRPVRRSQRHALASAPRCRSASSADAAPAAGRAVAVPRPRGAAVRRLLPRRLPRHLPALRADHAHRPHPAACSRSGPSRTPAPYRSPAEPLVYVTLGTVQNHPVLLREVVAGVAALPVRVLVAVGPRSTRTALGEQPAHVQVEAWVDQSEVLGRSSAVVSHGGSGTFLGALAHGLPQLCLPQAADQFRNAEGGVGPARRWSSARRRRRRPRCGPRSSGCCPTPTSGPAREGGRRDRGDAVLRRRRAAARGAVRLAQGLRHPGGDEQRRPDGGDLGDLAVLDAQHVHLERPEHASRRGGAGS